MLTLLPLHCALRANVGCKSLTATLLHYTNDPRHQYHTTNHTFRLPSSKLCYNRFGYCPPYLHAWLSNKKPHAALSNGAIRLSSSKLCPNWLRHCPTYLHASAYKTHSLSLTLSASFPALMKLSLWNQPSVKVRGVNTRCIRAG